MNTRQHTWDKLGTLIHAQTGRKLSGTSGGLYLFSQDTLEVPDLSVEGAVHELCHWVVASESERKQPNMGLSTDWQHHGFDRMVRCEELAWSLQYYLYSDPTVDVMASFMTPEAISGGGGVNGSYYNNTYGGRAPEYIPLVESAEAELERGKRLVEQEAERLRTEALRAAERVGLRVKEIKALIAAERERMAKGIREIQRLEEELRSLEPQNALRFLAAPTAPIEEDWDDIRDRGRRR